MSLNVYFTDDVKESPDFKAEKHIDKSDKLSVGDLSLFHDHGRLYAILGDLDSSVLPGHLACYVEKFSVYESVSCLARRETGVYTYGSAEARVDLDEFGKKPVYKVRIIGEKLEDLRTLLQKIKVGSIRPEESYEGSQTGTSRAELESECSSLKRELEGVQTEVSYLRQELRLKIAALLELENRFASLNEKSILLGKFAIALDNERWPLCTKNRITHEIYHILGKK